MKGKLDANGKELPQHLIDITGKKFGNVTVLGFDSIKDKRSHWKCICDCGAICFISRRHLCNNHASRSVISCGCIPRRSANGKRPLSEEFLSKYNCLMKLTKQVGECLEWIGHYGRGSIPRCSWKGNSMAARKCMYLVTNLMQDTKNIIYNTCGNLKCVNPDHLSIIAPKRGIYKSKDL